jgi:integrase
MGYTFARVGAATGMKVEDFYVQKRRGWVRLHEKGGKVTELPCHHNLDHYLEEWIAASGLGSEPEAPLFPTLRYGRLTDRTSPAPGQCAYDDPAPGTSCGTANQDQRSQLPRYRDHYLPSERRQA